MLFFGGFPNLEYTLKRGPQNYEATHWGHYNTHGRKVKEYSFHDIYNAITSEGRTVNSLNKALFGVYLLA